MRNLQKKVEQNKLLKVQPVKLIQNYLKKLFKEVNILLTIKSNYNEFFDEIMYLFQIAIFLLFIYLYLQSIA